VHIGAVFPNGSAQRDADVTGHHLILGGSGFIGRHVAILLARAGCRVTLASRHPIICAAPEEIWNHVSWQSVELGSAEWDTLVADTDIVHHSAWSSIPASANANPGGDLLTNVGATIGLLEALRRRGGGRVVFSSSGGTIYGRLHETPVREEHAVSPITAYGAGKATAEVYLSLYRALYNLDCRIARVANPFGAGQDLSRGLGAVTTFLHHALCRQPIVIWGTGEVVRDYIHISDVSKCLVKLAVGPRQEAFIFNVGSGVGISLNDVVLELEARLGRNLSVSRTDTRAFDVPVSVLAIERARNLLDWAPVLSFSEGMRRTLSDLSHQADFSNLD
jgi:UDP-glucose 4-epimerase